MFGSIFAVCNTREGVKPSIMRCVKVEIELDQTLLDEVMHRHHMRSPREAVNLALRSAINAGAEAEQDDDEDDPFGLAALDPHHHRHAG